MDKNRMRRYFLATLMFFGAVILCDALCSCVSDPDYVPKPLRVHYNTTTLKTSVEFGR